MNRARKISFAAALALLPICSQGAAPARPAHDRPNAVMIVSYLPAFETGELNEAVASTMDLFPTLCGLTGAAIPQHLDGKDLAPLLSGTSSSLERDYLFWNTKVEKAVRKGKWKLLITQKTPNAKLQITPTPKGAFLFNLEADPGETKNLIGRYPEIASELEKLIQQWKEEF